MLTINIAFDAGARRDPAGKAGLASLTASCLTLGTKTLTPEQFNRKVDFMGSSVSVGAGRDYAVAGLTTLKKYEDQTLNLLAQALTEPRLADKDIERKRDEQVAGIKSSLEDPGYVASVTFAKKLYGDGPYGNPVSGTPESVEKLTPADVRAFYHEHYRMGGAVISVAGDVNPEEVKAKLEKAFASLKGTVPAQAEPTAPKVAPGIHLDLVDRNIAQANVIMGFGGIARSNPDFYRLQVMNYVLGGGGFASRLMQTVRTRAGLAYSVYSGFDASKFPGPFGVILQTKNRSANEAIRLVLQQLKEIREKPMSEKELAAAKKFLIGSFPLKFDRLSSIANFMLQVELNKLGLNYADEYPKLIDAITTQQTLEVAKKYLHPGAIIVVVVANQKKAAVKVANLEK
jgi:zinc protease